jgi:hypothetical protein
MERVCHAFGYIFLGCDIRQAYFYSTFDKSVYAFDGARSLTFAISLSNREEVMNSSYDSYSDELFMITDKEIMLNRKGIISNFKNSGYDSFFKTIKGTFFVGNGGGVMLSPINGDIAPFELETEFLGVDGSTVCDYERVDIRLYSPDKKPLRFIVEMQTINQDTKESEQKRIDFKDWSSDGYKTIRLTPQYKKGTGLSLRIYCEQAIYVTNIEFTYEPVARTANSQRTGF